MIQAIENIMQHLVPYQEAIRHERLGHDDIVVVLDPHPLHAAPIRDERRGAWNDEPPHTIKGGVLPGAAFDILPPA